MEITMSIFARGRIAWILGMVFGIIVAIVGAVMNNTFLIVVGSGFGLFGLVFLILSLVTHGQTD
jgi:hypothetical protein